MKKTSLILFLVAALSVPVLAETPRSQNGLFPDEIVSADELKGMLDRKEKLMIFDARDKRSFDSLHIQGAVLPRGEEYYRQEELFRQGLVPAMPDPASALKAEMEKVARDTPIVAYCNSNCHAASALVLQLKSFGFTKARAMEEGVQAWERKGYPVVKAERVP